MWQWELMDECGARGNVVRNWNECGHYYGFVVYCQAECRSWLRWYNLSPSLVWAVMIFWTIKGKIIRTVPFRAVVYNSCKQWYAPIYEQFLKMCVGLGLVLVFIHLFRFNILSVFFWFSLDCFVLVLFAFVALGLVSSVLCREIGYEERLRSNPFCVEWGVKP